MSDYERVSASNGKVTFYPQDCPGPTLHVFTNEKTFTMNELEDRAETRKLLKLEPCYIEFKGMQVLSLATNSGPIKEKQAYGGAGFHPGGTVM